MSTTASSRSKILVIDDDPDVLTYIESVLRDAGYETLCALGGTEGLRLAREHDPDLICLDIVMPRPTGVRVYRDLRDDPKLSETPIVLITGVQKEFREFIHHRKLYRPPDGYITKPFDPADLIETLRRLLPVTV